MTTPFPLPKIYPITDPKLSGLSHLEQTKALIDGGAELIQIRDKTSTSKSFFDAAKKCLAYCRSKNVKLIINDRVDIAMILKADGVHLGQEDLPPAEARKLLGPEAIIGFSTHSIEQATEAIKQPVDYIAFGPIFSTTTKADHDRVVGLEKLNALRDVISEFPLVAIGGINLGNVKAVLAAGADSAAMISALVANKEKIVGNMISAIETAQKC